MADDATFITRLDASGPGPTLAVKDLIDVVGVPTTAGSRPVAEQASPASRDAACLAGARAAGARIVGKANLHELAFGAAGVNEWFGTPRNPLDPTRVPGGSSSGSAVAIATDQARLALGSDTGGSVRVPAAFCGIVGLKTTWGRVPLEGVWPLGPSLDTVGPMALDMARLVEAMALLEPGFAPADAAATVVGRLRPEGVIVDPVIDAAVDAALGAAGFELRDLRLPTWSEAFRRALDLLLVEAAASNAPLLEDPRRREQISRPVRERLESAADVDAGRLALARAGRAWLLGELAPLFAEVQLLALPTIGFFAPPLEEAYQHNYTLLTMQANLAGIPALSLPVPADAALPASLQLLAPTGGEELLCATGSVVEAAVRP